MKTSAARAGVRAPALNPPNGDGVEVHGQILSVAEIQQALRDLRTSRVSTATASEFALVRSRTHAAPMSSQHSTANTDEATSQASDPTSRQHGNRIPPDWIAVIAAHPGAGASTVALALSDAWAATGSRVRLIETAAPARSGLVAAATAEMGRDTTGAWLLGSRGTVTLIRRATEVGVMNWPADDTTDCVTVVDLGLPSSSQLAHLAEDGPRAVVVGRVSIPGVRMVEGVLDAVPPEQLVVAAIGGRRWPGEVIASLQSGLRELRTRGRVVAVPEDRRLQVTGPTHEPLPKTVAAAGAGLLRLLQAGDAADDPGQPRGPRTWRLR